MKYPKMKYFKFKLIYVQVPYDNRYYRLLYDNGIKWITIINVPWDYESIFRTFTAPLVNYGHRNNFQDRYEKFIERCRKYDNWLDKGDL